MNRFAAIFCAAALSLVFITPQVATSAEPKDWVGQQVMLKETATPSVGSKRLEWGAVPMPATVEQVNLPWLWLGTAWVNKDHVLTIDDAPGYYTDLIRRTGGREAIAYALRGISWILKGEYINSLKDFDEATRLEPQNSTYRTMHGKAQFYLRNFDAALSDFTEAIRLEPKNLVAYNDRGAAYNSMSNFQQAHEQYLEVLRVDPNNALAYNNRGANWLDRGDLDKALADLNESIRLSPKTAATYCNRGRVLMKRGDYPAAIADFEKAMKIAPNEWSSYQGWARLLATSPWEQLRDGKRAKELATKSCELSHWNEWRAIASLAAACAELGDYEAAVKWQTKAMAMDTPAKETDLRENEKRMAAYKDGKPYFDELPPETPFGEPAATDTPSDNPSAPAESPGDGTR